MIEKRNRMQEKMARGDSGEIDDIVDVAARKLEKPQAPRRRFLHGVEVMPAKADSDRR